MGIITEQDQEVLQSTGQARLGKGHVQPPENQTFLPHRSAKDLEGQKTVRYATSPLRGVRSSEVLEFDWIAEDGRTHERGVVFRIGDIPAQVSRESCRIRGNGKGIRVEAFIDRQLGFRQGTSVRRKLSVSQPRVVGRKRHQ